MRVLDIDAPRALIAAVDALRSGGLVAFPTDTVYGVAAIAADAAACERLFEAKGRPPERAIPIFIASARDLARVAEPTDDARRLAAAAWPGPLTIVLHRWPGFESAALAGGDTVAVRVPDHERVRTLVAAAGEPLAVTSANRSGGPNPRTADDVRAALGGAVDVLLDGGPCASDVPSTIVDLTVEPPRILREGAMPRAAIEAALGRAVV